MLPIPQQTKAIPNFLVAPFYKLTKFGWARIILLSEALSVGILEPHSAFVGG